MTGKSRTIHRQSFVLEPVPPFRLDLTVWTLRRRPDNAVDRWDGQTYRRLLSLGDLQVESEVTQVRPPGTPRLRVTLWSAASPDRKLRQAATATLERLLGLSRDLRGFYRLASDDAHLWRLADRFRGMKPPRFETVFECLVNAVACQQVSLNVGILLLNRLAEKFGERGPADPSAHAFPRPEDLRDLRPRLLMQIGFSRRKAEYIIDLARSIVVGEFNPELLADRPNEMALARLGAVRGVGRWSAEYVLLRGLGRLDVFPGDDVGARNNLQRWLRLRKALDYEGAHRKLARWRPYAGLVYFHLLLDRLAQAGYVPTEGRLQRPGIRLAGTL